MRRALLEGGSMRHRSFLMTLLVLAGCSGGGGSSGSSASTTAPASQTTAAPIVATADVDSSGTPTTFLLDMSKPSGSRVVQAVGIDASGQLVAKSSSASAENVAD